MSHLPRMRRKQAAPSPPSSRSSRPVQLPSYAPPPDPSNDPNSQVKQLENLLQERTEEFETLKAKAVEFQNRLDRVSKLLPLTDQQSSQNSLPATHEEN